MFDSKLFRTLIAGLIVVVSIRPGLCAETEVHRNKHQHDTDIDKSDQTAITIEQTLRAVPKAASETLLFVSPESVQMAAKKTNARSMSLGELAAYFGYIVREFGGIKVVAPPTMTVLNRRPSKPNLLSDFLPQEAAQLFMASLSPEQWETLQSETGIGKSELRNEYQQSLFDLIVPSRSKIRPCVLKDIGQQDDDSRIITVSLSSSRLRVGKELQIAFPVKGQPTASVWVSPTPDNASAKPRYQIVSRLAEPSENLYGVSIKSQTKNIPKTSNLDTSATVFRRQVSTEGVTNVSELISRLSKITGVELYADERYAHRRLTIVGSINNVCPAGDLLQSLAFATSGTYRRVGEAYVLTNDIVGLGAQKQTLADFAELCAKQKKEMLAREIIKFNQAHSASDLAVTLKSHGNNIEMTDEQRNKAQSGKGGLVSFSDEIRNLSPAQQDLVHQIARDIAPVGDFDLKPEIDKGVRLYPDLSGKITVFYVPALQMLAPNIDGPVELGINLGGVGGISKAANLTSAPSSETAPVRRVNLPKVAHQALLIAPKDINDVPRIVAFMTRKGLDNLWLSVPINDSLQLSGAAVGSDTTHYLDKLLSAVEEATVGTNVQLTVVVDIFRYTKESLGFQPDVTVFGRSFRETLSANVMPTEVQVSAPPSSVTSSNVVAYEYMDQFSSITRDNLSRLLQKLKQHPKVKAIVWRRVSPPGYDVNPRSFPSASLPELGYSVEARLAFLRKFHVDPIDISSPSRHDISSLIPEFEDGNLDQRMRTQWIMFRNDVNRKLLVDLVSPTQTAYAKSARQVPVFIQERRGTGRLRWYGLWDGERNEIPTYHSSFDETTPGIWSRRSEPS
jgi:hypothetical protein